MDLASIAFISTYKSWHCVTSIKITLKNFTTKLFTYENGYPVAAFARCHRAATRDGYLPSMLE